MTSTFWTALDGARIHLHRAPAVTERQGRVILLHGLGEHGGRYWRVTEQLASAGLEPTVIDLRGHGKSPGRRGDIPRYASLVDDLQGVVELLARESNQPIVLCGQSLGGGVVAQWLTHRHHPLVKGAVLLAPWLRLTHPPATWKIPLFRLAAALVPWWRVVGVPPLDQLMSSEEAIVECLNDELCHPWISLGLAVQAFDAGHNSLQHASCCQVSVLALHSPTDTVTAAAATEEFCRTVPRGEYRPIPQVLHDLPQEIGTSEHFQRVISWMQQCATRDE